MPTNKTTAKSAKANKATAKKTTAKRTASSKATAKTGVSKKVTRKQPTTKRASSRPGAPSTRISSSETARPGDIIVIDSAQVGSPHREGEVLKVTVGAFSVRYQVRWGDGHETIISPSGGIARIIRT